MTVANQSNRVSAVGSGSVAQAVPFSFPITATSDLNVIQRVTDTGVESTLVETTNYTVAITGDTGGTLTTVTAIAVSAEIHLIRDTPNTQNLDLIAGGPWNPELAEDAWDKAVKLTIEDKDKLTRALRAPATDPTALNMVLPNSVDRASKNLGFDASGNPTVTDSSGTFATTSAFWDVLQVKDPWLDVRAFGATGDGVTDDVLAIQAAIDAANGRVVFFPAGDYVISTALVITDKTSLKGVGHDNATSSLGTIINYTGAATAIDVNGGNAELNGRISDLNLNTSTGVTGILLQDLVGYELNNVVVKGFSSRGVHLLADSAGASEFVISVRILGCHITVNGIGIEASNKNAAINHIQIRNSRVRANTSYNIYTASDVRGWVLHGNDFESAGTTAVHIKNPLGISISSNYFEIGTSNGIVIEGGITTRATYGISITSNYFAGISDGSDFITLGQSGGKGVSGFLVAGNVFLPGVGMTGSCVNVIVGQSGQVGPNHTETFPTTSGGSLYTMGTVTDVIQYGENVWGSSAAVGPVSEVISWENENVFYENELVLN